MFEEIPSDFDAFVIEGEGDNAFWTKIGAAWAHDDDKGFNLQLIVMPMNGRVALREVKERESEESRKSYGT